MKTERRTLKSDFSLSGDVLIIEAQSSHSPTGMSLVALVRPFRMGDSTCVAQAHCMHGISSDSEPYIVIEPCGDESFIDRVATGFEVEWFFFMSSRMSNGYAGVRDFRKAYPDGDFPDKSEVTARLEALIDADPFHIALRERTALSSALNGVASLDADMTNKRKKRRL